MGKYEERELPVAGADAAYEQELEEAVRQLRSSEAFMVAVVTKNGSLQMRVTLKPDSSISDAFVPAFVAAIRNGLDVFEREREEAS